MKFKRLERYEVAAWTPRKLALATSKPARMAKKLESTYPLIAEQLKKNTYQNRLTEARWCRKSIGYIS